MELAAPLAWPPGTTAALWQVFSGLDESKESISQRFAVALEQPTFHNYGPSIRTENNGKRNSFKNLGLGLSLGRLIVLVEGRVGSISRTLRRYSGLSVRCPPKDRAGAHFRIPVITMRSRPAGRMIPPGEHRGSAPRFLG